MLLYLLFALKTISIDLTKKIFILVSLENGSVEFLMLSFQKLIAHVFSCGCKILSDITFFHLKIVPLMFLVSQDQGLIPTNYFSIFLFENVFILLRSLI